MHKLKQLLECSDSIAINIIVRCFGAMTKSNSVSMTNDLAADRQNFDFYVRIFRQQYQQLLLIAASAFDVNSRSRFKTSVEKNLNFFVSAFVSAEINGLN